MKNKKPTQKKNYLKKYLYSLSLSYRTIFWRLSYEMSVFINCRGWNMAGGCCRIAVLRFWEQTSVTALQAARNTLTAEPVLFDRVVGVRGVDGGAKLLQLICWVAASMRIKWKRSLKWEYWGAGVPSSCALADIVTAGGVIWCSRVRR